MIRETIALLIPAAIGGLAAQAFWPRASVGARRPAGQTAFFYFLGWPLGWGICAGIYFLCSLLFQRPGIPSVCIEALVLATLALYSRAQYPLATPSRRSESQVKAADRRWFPTKNGGPPLQPSFISEDTYETQAPVPAQPTKSADGLPRPIGRPPTPQPAARSEVSPPNEGSTAPQTTAEPSHLPTLGAIEAILLTVFILIAVAALVVSIRAAQAEPFGSWDGWAIWNFHARFIDRAQDAWPALLRSPQVAWSHPDYPLLVPANVARLWAWIGREAPSGAAAVSLLFGVGTVGLLVTALVRRRGLITALLAGIALLSTPFFVTFASNEHADIPFGLFMLATCVLLAEWPSSTSGSGSTPIRLAALTGATIGLAASVKNEGEPFALIATLAWIFLSLRHRTLRSTALAFGLGLLLALAPLLLFKLHYAPPNDLAASHPLGRLGQLFAPARHHLILAALRRDLPGFGQWRWIPFLPLALVLLGRGWRRLTLAEGTIAAVLVLTALGYYVVYLLSPFDLRWHLDSSLVRLLLQLWPSALFFWGLAASIPPAAPPSSRPLPIPSRWLLLSLNAAGALLILFLFNRQLAPNEFAATRFHAVHAVPGTDWYPAEASAHSRWSWSSGRSTLHLVSASGHTVHLTFAARGLRPQRLTVRQDGRILWSAPLDARLTRFSLPPLTAPSDLVFTSDQPGVAESTDARSRTLAFAVYDLRIE